MRKFEQTFKKIKDVTHSVFYLTLKVFNSSCECEHLQIIFSFDNEKMIRNHFYLKKNRSAVHMEPNGFNVFFLASSYAI